MPAITSITVEDGKATPVAHTFAAHTAQTGSVPSRFYEKSAGSLTGWLDLSNLVQKNDASQSTKVTVKLRQPVVDSNGLVIRQNLFVGQWIIADSATEAERNDFAAYVSNTMDNSVIRATITDLEPIY
jgi:hypothetical protein